MSRLTKTELTLVEWEKWKQFIACCYDLTTAELADTILEWVGDAKAKELLAQSEQED